MAKKRVLLIWWELDHRPEFLQPFIDMSDELEFTQLIYKNKKERTGSSSPFKMVYWHDYINARAVLKDLKPEVIIGVTESIFATALINSARKAGIPYYGMQHGFIHDSISTFTVDTRKFGIGMLGSYIKSTLFFLFSFSIFNVRKYCSAVYFYWLYPKMLIHKLLKENYFPWLVPDYYVCFSPYSAEHYKEVYRLKEEQIKYIGILWFDQFFKKLVTLQHTTSATEKYYLLIDTCFDNYSKPISKEQVNRFYTTLAAFCEKEQAKLKIKLHPWNYNKQDLLQHPNIEYLRKLDDDELFTTIRDSEGCFSFYSTLLLPVLAIKQLIQIDSNAVYLAIAKERGITPVINFFDCTVDDIHFPGDQKSELNKTDLEYLLYKTDGHAKERLKAILLSA